MQNKKEKTDRKKISVVIPCYNEENSVFEMYDRLTAVFQELPKYDYEIIYADDCSPDSTWDKIASICKKDQRIKGVHNITNFGPVRNIFQAVKLGKGDAVFLLMGDLQEPPERLPEFLQYWEEGYQAVIGVHPNSKDKGIMVFCRKLYYKWMRILSNNKIIPNFSYYGLYSREIIDCLQEIEDIQPFFPGIVAEYTGKIKMIEVCQETSKRGKSGQNFFKKYDQAMIGLTSYTKLLMRLATFVGLLIGIIAVIFAMFALCMKLIFWESYPMGIPTVIIGIFFLGAIQLFFLGIMGEYILSINERSMKRPLTAIDKRLNFIEEINK